MFLAHLIFLLQFSVDIPHHGGILVISEVNPESYLVVAFIIKLCVDADVPDFELNHRGLCVSLSFYINTIDVTESTQVMSANIFQIWSINRAG